MKGGVAVTVDCVVFGVGEDGLEVLLVERGWEPFAGCLALPGGFVEPDESLEDAARRELVEETGVELSYLEQLYTFGAPDRDPRQRVVTVAWLALVRSAAHGPRGGTDAAAARWVPVTEATGLAFDHDGILALGLERLRGKLRYQPIGFDLLPETFTLTQLQRLYEVILDKSLDKRTFRRKVLAGGLLIDTGARLEGVAHRAPALYRFDRDRYLQQERDGIFFEV